MLNLCLFYIIFHANVEDAIVQILVAFVRNHAGICSSISFMDVWSHSLAFVSTVTQ